MSEDGRAQLGAWLNEAGLLGNTRFGHLEGIALVEETRKEFRECILRKHFDLTQIFALVGAAIRYEVTCSMDVLSIIQQYRNRSEPLNDFIKENLDVNLDQQAGASIAGIYTRYVYSISAVIAVAMVRACRELVSSEEVLPLTETAATLFPTYGFHILLEVLSSLVEPGATPGDPIGLQIAIAGVARLSNESDDVQSVGRLIASSLSDDTTSSAMEIESEWR